MLSFVANPDWVLCNTYALCSVVVRTPKTKPVLLQFCSCCAQYFNLHKFQNFSLLSTKWWSSRLRVVPCMNNQLAYVQICLFVQIPSLPVLAICMLLQKRTVSSEEKILYWKCLYFVPLIFLVFCLSVWQWSGCFDEACTCKKKKKKAVCIRGKNYHLNFCLNFDCSILLTFSDV